MGGQPIWKRLTYRPWDVQSHPIDLVEGPQGWGPFDGPYTPKDYLSPATMMGMSGINIGYNVQAFVTDHGPGYHDITVFPDRSTSSVNNVLVKAANDQTPGMTPGVTYTSTIANSLNRARETQSSTNTSGVADLLTRLRNAVGGGE